MEAIGDEFANFSPKKYFPSIDFSHFSYFAAAENRPRIKKYKRK